MEFIRTLLRLMRALNDREVDYVLVGGAALNVHGLVRATRDIDLFVAPEPDNVDRLRKALRDVWDDPCIDDISEEDLCGDYPAVRYGPPEGNVSLDILTRLGEATRYADLEAQVVELDGVPVRVATPHALIRMKRGTVRPVDQQDARALIEAFGPTEEDDGG